MFYTVIQAKLLLYTLIQVITFDDKTRTATTLWIYIVYFYITWTFNICIIKLWVNSREQKAGFWSDLSARLRNEALNLHSVSGSWEWSLPQLLHEWVDHGHGDLPPLLHFIEYLSTHGRTPHVKLYSTNKYQYNPIRSLEIVKLKKKEKEKNPISFL